MLGSLSKKENQPPNKRCFYNERKSLVAARRGKAEESITASWPTEGASSGSRTKPSGAGGKGSAWECRGSSTMADLFTASAEPGCPLWDRLWSQHSLEKKAEAVYSLFYFIIIRAAQQHAQKALAGLWDAPEVNKKWWLNKCWPRNYEHFKSHPPLFWVFLPLHQSGILKPPQLHSSMP